MSCSCGKEPDTKAVVKVYCGECSEVIKTVKFKKPMKALGIAILCTAAGGQAVEYAITDNRYPIKTEYEIVDQCVNAHGKAIKENAYKRIKKICLCALEETMNEISFTRYIVNENSFINALNRRIKECK